MNYTFGKLLGLALICGVVARPASAVLVLDEQFDDNSSNVAVDSNYAAYTLSGTGTGSVVSQRLNLTGGALTFTTNSTYSGELDISVDLSATGADVGNSQLALVLDGAGSNDNKVLFHIGFTGAALRVEGTGGFGNTDVGFTPAQGTTLHTLSVHSDGAGQFSVTMEDGNSLASFTTAWTNLGLTAFTVGLAYNSGTGIFDNWTITTPTPVPEAGAWLFGGLAAAISGLGVWMRRNRKGDITENRKGDITDY